MTWAFTEPPPPERPLSWRQSHFTVSCRREKRVYYISHRRLRWRHTPWRQLPTQQHSSKLRRNFPLRTSNWKLNPLPPSDAVRKQKKRIFLAHVSTVLSKFKKYHPSGNLKSDSLGIFQSLKLRNLMGKTLQIYPNLNFIPNSLGCYGFS